MAYKQNNPFLTNIDPPADRITESNIEKRKGAQKAYEDEMRRVEQVRQNIINVAERGASSDEFTRNDIKGGKLVPEKTYNWLESTGGMGCSTYACSIMREAGVTVPDSVGPEGITINNVTYKPGDPMPIIPGNEQFDAVAPKLGFELKPGGSLPEGGEVTRVGYGLGKTGHSAIQTGKGTTIYNPGNVGRGLKESDFFTGLSLSQRGVPDDDKTYENRLMEYRGNLPELHKKVREADKPFMEIGSRLKPIGIIRPEIQTMNLSKEMANFFNRKK